MAVYSDLLAQAWLDHKAPKAADAPTVVSTFAGAGGSTLGYSMAGYKELMAVEWEDHAASCYKRNFPHVNLFHGDIAKVDPDSLGLAPGELDVFDGSPPCQGFSMHGKRDLKDPRNQLFREFVRLLDAWQPKTFVMENVASMASSHTRPLFVEILKTLRRSGYKVTARVVDAQYLGVPQSRKRMIFIGVREDLGIEPPFPRPRARTFTVNDAIRDIPQSKIGKIHHIKGKYAPIVPHVPPGKDVAHIAEKVGHKRVAFSLIRLHPDKPSNTIVKMTNNSAGLLHPSKDRFISTTEASRLQSFPDDYDWGDSKYEQIIARIGNSVPPLMMREIARVIDREVLQKV